MPPTSGKRVTRSRAAAVKPADEMDARPKRTPAAQAAPRRAKADTVDDNTENPALITKAKRPTRAATAVEPALTAPRRRVKVTPLDAPLPEEAPDEVVPAKTKATTAKKIPASASDKSEDLDESGQNESTPKPKTRAKPAAKGKHVAGESAPKTRGRPKTSTAVAKETEPASKETRVWNTRSRAASGVADTQTTTASAAKVAAPPRKKVTFQDLPDSDKENQPVVAKNAPKKVKTAPASTGIKAKPVRKPGTTAAKKTKKATRKPDTEEEKPMPLSPKKVTQVAKSSSPGSDDELSGAKTPVRDLSQSPKRNPPFAASISPVKKLEFSHTLAAQSPAKTAAASAISSPARRLPQSPFKDALKDSPKRGEASLIFPAANNQSISIASVLATSTSQAQSTIMQSPKRGAIDNSMFAHSTIKPMNSPSKPTLLQSPAKRLFSPTKPRTTHMSPTKSVSEVEQHDFAVSCNFRSSRSPERSMKVHRLSDEELTYEAYGTVDFDESVLNIGSPMKVSKVAPSLLETTEEAPEELPSIVNDLTIEASGIHDDVTIQPGLKSLDVDLAGEPMEGIATSLNSGTEVVDATFVPQAAADIESTPLFHSSRFREDDEGSEDELQADATTVIEVPTTTPRRASGRPRHSTVNPADTSNQAAFTPLATQLSSWLAASPEKPQQLVPPPRGSFSPLAAQHVPGKVQISRRSTSQRSPFGTRASLSGGTPAARISTASTRRIFELVASPSPEQPSHFADEMLAKDLEEQIEVRRASEDNELPVEEVAKNVTAVELTPFGEAEASAEVAQESANPSREPLEAAAPKTGSAGHDLALASPAQEEIDASSGPAEEETTLILPTGASEGVVDATEPVLEVTTEVSGPDFDEPDQALAEVLAPTTPIYKVSGLSVFANTVISKVPLRAEGNTSPIKVQRKRSRSLSAGHASAKKPVHAPSYIPRSNTVISLSPERRAQSPTQSTPGQQSFVVDDFGDSTLDGIDVDEDDENLPPPTPTATIRSTVATAARSPLKEAKGVLQGSVVFVDVHTTEGADASGIFVELLSQMGAKCVKSWSWNPRASIAPGEFDAENTPLNLADKVGITHVVYKDGGKRTLEKVRDAEGLVRCVGVGWVLE